MLLLRYARLPARKKFSLAYTAAIVHCYAGKWAEARTFLENLEKLFAQLPRNRGWRTWQQNRESLRFSFRLLTEGGSEELLAAFQRGWTLPSTAVSRSRPTPTLPAASWTRAGGTRPRPHLAFVAENGGMLAIRAEAWARLPPLSSAEN